MKQILVVDDDEDTLFVLEILFKQRGFEVITANNGDLALQNVSSQTDIVITDLYLEAENVSIKTGLELLEAIRREGLDTPVVLMTSQHKIPDHPELAGTIHKPFRPEEVVREAQKILGE